MSCAFCRHFVRPDNWYNEPGEDNWLNGRGHCTLYPEWIDVDAYHYCGQISIESGSALVNLRERKSEMGKEIVRMKEEIKRLRAANKRRRDREKSKATVKSKDTDPVSH